MVQGAGGFIAGAFLRPMDELVAYYSRLSIVQCCLRCRGLIVEGAKPMLERIVRQELDELGVHEADFSVAHESVACLSDEQYRPLPGTYVVRVHAAGWLVGERDRYWGDEEELGDDEGLGDEK